MLEKATFHLFSANPPVLSDEALTSRLRLLLVVKVPNKGKTKKDLVTWEYQS